VELSALGTYRLDISGGELGGIDATGNHTAWTGDLDDGILATADSETTTKTFELEFSGVKDEARAFFRVEG
jgi:hypothetical protein